MAKKSSKPVVKSDKLVKQSTLSKKRKLNVKHYKSFKLSKKVKVYQTSLPSVYKLTKKTISLLRSHWRLFGGMVVVYAILSLAGGFGINNNIQDLKTNLQNNGQSNNLLNSVSVYTSLISSSNSSSSSSDQSSMYQLFLLTIFTLASLWALRQVQAGKKISIKQSFYSGMYPLVQFLLVFIVVMLQMLPFLAGSFLYSSVVNGGVAVEIGEKVIWGLLSGLLIILSLYMTTSSIFALCIVTLPEMQPMQALRSAREIVRYRRFEVMRKVLALPLVLVLIMGIIVVPLIILWSTLAEVVFFALSMAAVLFGLSYIYLLYRELL